MKDAEDWGELCRIGITTSTLRAGRTSRHENIWLDAIEGIIIILYETRRSPAIRMGQQREVAASGGIPLKTQVLQNIWIRRRSGFGHKKMISFHYATSVILDAYPPVLASVLCHNRTSIWRHW